MYSLPASFCVITFPETLRHQPQTPDPDRGLWKNMQYLYICTICIKTAMSGPGVSGLCIEVSGWCLVVSGGIWMESGWVLVSGNISIPNPLAKNFIRSDIAFSSNGLWCITNSNVWGCLDGVYGRLGGVWIVSKGVWQMCGRYRCHINLKRLNEGRFIQLLLFLPVTSHLCNLCFV